MKANTASPTARAAALPPKKTFAIYINGKIALKGIDEALKAKHGENASELIRGMTMVPEMAKSIE